MIFALSKSVTRRLAVTGALLGSLTLAACGSSAFDDLNDTTPQGSAFQVALYKNYAYLARSFGAVGKPSGTAFDASASMSLSDVDESVADLANAYAQKAVDAGNGKDVQPEDAPDGNDEAAALRTRLLTALDDGRDKAPADAARAQADYDCWIMDAKVDSQVNASSRCRQSLDASLARLEQDVGAAEAPPPPPPPPVEQTAPAPETSAPPPPPSAEAPAPMPEQGEYTVYFDFDSWTLTAEDLTTITNAVDAARKGGQSHINVVGHTDTSGTAEYNQRLSVRRAKVVKEVMVQMGARPESIRTSGVGENDLAVQTGDDVKEAKNRRSVITLVP